MAAPNLSLGCSRAEWSLGARRREAIRLPTSPLSSWSGSEVTASDLWVRPAGRGRIHGELVRGLQGAARPGRRDGGRARGRGPARGRARGRRRGRARVRGRAGECRPSGRGRRRTGLARLRGARASRGRARRPGREGAPGLARRSRPAGRWTNSSTRWGAMIKTRARARPCSSRSRAAAAPARTRSTLRIALVVPDNNIRRGGDRVRGCAPLPARPRGHARP